jgi:hypothetical protein
MGASVDRLPLDIRPLAGAQSGRDRPMPDFDLPLFRPHDGATT